MNRIPYIISLCIIACGCLSTKQISDDLFRVQNVTNTGTVNGQINIGHNSGPIDNKRITNYQITNNYYNLEIIFKKDDPIFFNALNNVKLDHVMIDDKKYSDIGTFFYICANRSVKKRIKVYYTQKHNITSDSLNVSSSNGANGDTIRYTIIHYHDKQLNKLTINGNVSDTLGYFIMPDTNVYIKGFYIPIKKRHSIIVSDETIAVQQDAYQGESIPFTVINKTRLAYISIDGKKYDIETRSFVMPDKNVLIEPHYYQTTKDTFQPNGTLSIRAYIDSQGRTIRQDIYDIKGVFIRTLYN